MKYLKVFTDFAEKIEVLSDAEKGRLFTAMLKYAETGAVPDFGGNERYLWATAKQEIDRQRTSYDAMCERNKSNITSRYQSLPKATKSYHSYQDKDKDKDKDYNPPIIPPGGWPGVEEGPLLDALRGYEDMRKRQNVPLEDDDKPILLDRLKTLSNQENEWAAMLKKATLCRWKNVYPLKEDEKPKPERMDDLDEFF